MSPATADARSPRLARKFEAKRVRVLDAAMAIVLREGVPGLTLAKVARVLDVAVGGLYRYFPSKDAIVVGLQQRAITEFGSRLGAALAQRRWPSKAGPAALARAMFIVGFYLQEAQTEPQAHRLMDVFLSSQDPSLAIDDVRTVERILAPIIDSCSTELRRAADAGTLEPGDARSRTLVLWGATHGIEHLRHRARIEADAYGVMALARDFWCSILRGWGATRSAAAAAIEAAAP